MARGGLVNALPGAVVVLWGAMHSPARRAYLSGGSERTQRGTWHFVFTLEGVELVVLTVGSKWGFKVGHDQFCI